MLTVGKVTIKPNRQKAIESGGIICLMEHDKVRRFWHGIGRGCDFMLVESVTDDGTRWVMGRVRIHKDDKMWGSSDKKEVYQVAFASDVPDHVVAACVKGVEAAAKILGIEAVTAIDTAMCNAEEFSAFLVSFTQKTDGQLSMISHEPKDDLKDRDAGQ